MGVEPVLGAAGCDDLASVLLTEEQIQARVVELGAQIARDYKDQYPLLVGVLKGSIVFLADLMRKIQIPLEIDLLCVSSYGLNSRTSGELTLLKDLAVDVRGRHVLLVEDIVDSGVTLSHLMDLLGRRDPASLRICALLSKPDRRQVQIEMAYTGFEIPDEFVVGYGLDYAERFRWLPCVAVLKPEAYA